MATPVEQFVAQVSQAARGAGAGSVRAFLVFAMGQDGRVYAFGSSDAAPQLRLAIKRKFGFLDPGEGGAAAEDETAVEWPRG